MHFFMVGGLAMVSFGDILIRTDAAHHGNRGWRWEEGQVSQQCLGGDGSELIALVGDDVHFWLESVDYDREIVTATGRGELGSMVIVLAAAK